ncbi:Mitochondrial genome maintenance protein [Penicillium diatomitis]|uniref:Mitochondrial genome maintenance protein MGM101 n=1 Tax=Penicillium diatomitis TaxID=2819901 RepID=A0A9X0BUE1_9EURO|nr:Mitochondrial genome maintenance protein [Penicillium diatomitis]KAJ5485083.1 Mitochondrial genome maintenance protein [Penicillium diatomitis]
MSITRYRLWRTLETVQNRAALPEASRTRISPIPSCAWTPKRGITYSSTRSQTSNSKSNVPTTSSSSSTASSHSPRATPSASPSSPSSPSSTASQASRVAAGTPNRPTTENISKSGLADKPLELETAPEEKIDWTRSFHGLSAEPFPKEAADILLAETAPEEVEIKPDGIVYLPEIKYRRILNKAFAANMALFSPLSCSLVSVARGEQDYFSPDGIPTATEGCRSNALVRCCKDLGIASELWDPRWIRKYKAKYAREVFVEHVVSKKKSKIWTRKDDPVGYPWKESK